MKDKYIDFPISPAKFPFFYGWVIVVVTTIGFIASIPGQTMGVGVFTDFLIESLQLSRMQLSTAYMIGTILSSLILPHAGKFLDRVGSRIMTIFVSIGLGISMVLLSKLDFLTNFLVGNSFIFVMMMASLTFLFLRFFGQGCLTMISRVLIGKWFNFRRGLASAISGIFVSIGFNSSPVFLNWLVEHYGWREAAHILAALVGLGMSLLAWIFFRDTPEQCGLVMDGKTDEIWSKKMTSKTAKTQKEFTKKEAIRTHSFWAFSLGMAVVGLVITAITFHISSIGTENGLERTASYQVFVWMFPFSIAANFIGSWISDRIKHKWLLMIMMINQLAAMFGMLIFSSTIGRLIFAAGQGAAGGLFVALSTVVLPRFFGRQHLGEISGLTMSIMVFGSAIGPVLFSWMRNLSGSYQEIFLYSMILPIVIIFTAFKADNPQLKLILSSD